MLILYSFSFFLVWGTLLARRPFVWQHAKGRCNKFEGNARTREASLLLSTWNKYGKKNAHQQPLELAELSENKLGLQERTYHGDLKSGIHSQRYLFLSWDLLPIHLTQRREHLGKLGYNSLVPPG